jgi:hypothetical protein
VSTVLTEIGRDDLVEVAQLGVSELVTNALIHSRPPLSVRVLGTIDHPRIEVLDSSPVPPQRAPVVPDIADVDDLNVTTFGRGLDLVAMMSNRWGSDLGHDRASKSVWFEPTPELNGEAQLEGEIFTFDPDNVDGLEHVDPRRMPLRLLNLPARIFGDLRRYHFELRRELRLVAMTAPEDYPLAARVTEVFMQADRERRSSTGIDALDRAIAEGVESVDLEYSVPLSAPATMVQIRDMLDEVYHAFSRENLLALRPPDLLVQLQHWYFTEFERQGAGEQPVPWPGPITLSSTA